MTNTLSATPPAEEGIPEDDRARRAFEAIHDLAMRGKLITEDPQLQAILDKIAALARYESDIFQVPEATN